MASGWDRAKVDVFGDQFLNQFLTVVVVNSKELGRICLADHVYRAQTMVLDGIFGGLSEDKHWFDILKSRQLGISTLLRALSLFWLGVFDGLKGYSIMDTDHHKEESRLEIIAMIENLPRSFDFPRIKRQNRYMILLENDSLLNFASGGVKAGKSSGTLGRSSGVNFAHVSEMCSIDNVDGIESFKNSLAEDFPDRLYLWESTARGFNQREEMWRETKADTAHKVGIFCGWWAKDNQVIDRDDADFGRYGVQPPTKEEMKKIVEVKERYNWQITPEQLAWIRRKMDPLAQDEGDAQADHSGDPLRIQEQPWTEDEAFQQTGATFFQPEVLTDMTNAYGSRKFKTYSFTAGAEFSDCRVYPAYNARSVQLKVWDEPDIADAVYVISADVAGGSSEDNDRSAIQVLRAYADGLDQVAEYAWPLITSQQFAWVIMALVAWYAQDSNEVYLIIEINGPGEATWNEIRSLKRQISLGYNRSAIEEKGLANIFANVRNYIYSRSDSMSPGRNYQWRTTHQLKVNIMERCRDFTSNGMLHVRSLDTIAEMKSVTREGDSIKAGGSKKDDRVVSLAMGVRCWDERARPKLMMGKRTREAEAAKKRMSVSDLASLFNKNMMGQFMGEKNATRMRQERAERQAMIRARRGRR